MVPDGAASLVTAPVASNPIVALPPSKKLPQPPSGAAGTSTNLAGENGRGSSAASSPATASASHEPAGSAVTALVRKLRCSSQIQTADL